MHFNGCLQHRLSTLDLLNRTPLVIVTILQLVELLNRPGKWTREDLIHVMRCTLVFVL
jgi:hypothetical protein